MDRDHAENRALQRQRGTVANVLSEVARVNAPFCGSYSASKAAVWSATQCMRAELAGQGTHVLAALLPGSDAIPD